MSVHLPVNGLAVISETITIGETSDQLSIEEHSCIANASLALLGSLHTTAQHLLVTSKLLSQKVC
jgi:hypothetical protein